MTTQRFQEAPVVIDEPDIARLVGQAVDSMSTEKATAFAISVGVRPPTDDPGWRLIVGIDGPDEPAKLLWELVTEEDDEV